MHDTEFAYGVAHIRAHELSLLTNDNLESMISASNLNEAIRVLGDVVQKNIFLIALLSKMISII